MQCNSLVFVVFMMCVGCGPVEVGGHADTDGMDTDDGTGSTTTVGSSTGTGGPTGDPTASTTTSEPTATTDPTGDRPPEPPPEDWPESEGPPTEGWFVFAGTSEPDMNRIDCLYRWEPDSEPAPLYCPAAAPEPVEQPPPRLLGAIPPAQGSRYLWVLTEEFALDVYPEYIWRIDALTGENEYVGSWEADPNGGPSRHLERMIAIDDDCVAWQIRVQPLGGEAFDQLGVSCVGEFPDPEFDATGIVQELRGVLDDGRLLVETNGGVLELVDPGPDERTRITGVRDGGFAHDGQRITYLAPEPISVAHVELWDDGTVTRMNDVLNPSAGLGFLPSGEVLSGSGVMRSWDGTDGADGVQLSGLRGALSIRDFVTVGDYAGFRVSSFDQLAGVAFASDTAVSPMCGGDHWARRLANVYDSEEVVLVHTQTDPDSPQRHHIFSCRPGGEPVDLLEGTGLRGRTLPMFEPTLDP